MRGVSGRTKGELGSLYLDLYLLSAEALTEARAPKKARMKVEATRMIRSLVVLGS